MENRYPYTQFYVEDKDEIDETVGGFQSYPHTDFSQVDEDVIPELNDGIAQLVKAVTNPTATTTIGDTPNVNVTIDNEHLNFNFTLPNGGASGLKPYELVWENSRLYYDSEQLSYNELATLCSDKNNYVYINANKRLFTMSYIDIGTIVFTSGSTYLTSPFIYAISVNNNGIATLSTLAIAKNTELTTLNNKITTLETDNTTNKSNITSLQGRATTLENDNVAIKRDIDDISNAIDNLNGEVVELDERVTTLENRSETSLTPELLWSGELYSGNTGNFSLKGHNAIVIEVTISTNSRAVAFYPITFFPLGTSVQYAITSEANYITLTIQRIDNDTIRVNKIGATSSTQSIRRVVGVL